MLVDIGNMVYQYLSTPNVEIEFRFGRKTNRGFDTNIGVHTYQRVIRRLERYTGWDSVIVRNDTMYYNDTMRARYNNLTDEMDEVIHKRRVEVSDYVMQPLDVRVAISTETPLKYNNEDFTSSKERVRNSYIRKNISIDVSMIKCDPEDKDQESNIEYQIEMEILNPSEITDDRKLTSALLKIMDILKILT
jgi:hypothetical protein